ncbi:ABC transporter substrate-binding protein [Bradyrhizobium sp. CB1650]|uniref:ABC transporter substrate-binding protein n=1 Tax=Bradyrhizobium sp. CB1650 TaxID=3039153 RepID=UPI0024361088|nr:ABC transporter substrate-binding protein [Bradyrhizobium sp. CB1650]WGD51143.1 ABC transporter substrate-binding protein [Bradyrhizobium sp. CB1650]
MGAFTRREILQTGVALAGAAVGPKAVMGQSRNYKVIRAIGDIPAYDPVVSTTDATLYHAVMVYDTLFGLDAQQIAQPQMVGKYGLSEDKLTWTFELREGLKFHDGTAVTTGDVAASIRRWAAKDGRGQLMMERLKDISTKDDKTFTVQLKEPFGLLLDGLGSNCLIMRTKEAETDPARKIEAIVGSGPFRFNQAETRPGVQYVYDRNLDYLPRKEPASGLAGGKVVKVDRVVYVNITDPHTAVAAVQAGEADFFSDPPTDLIDQLSHDSNVKLEVLCPGGSTGMIRLNFLQPPFDNVKCRQALLYLVNQIDFMKGNFANPSYFKTCPSYFSCGTTMENDANTEWFNAAPDYARAKQLLKEGGYDGRAVLILQPTNWPLAKSSAEILAQQMRLAGMSVQLVPLDWGGVVARRAVKAPPEQGGWNIFLTSNGTAVTSDPLHIVNAANGDRAWFGWPDNAKHEELRAKWLRAETIEERKKIAREIQENAWDFVPFVTFGQWMQPMLLRPNLKGMMKVPFSWLRPWWNVEKA